VRHPLCPHVEIVPLDRGVLVRVLQHGRVAEQRTFVSIKSANRFFARALYCGRKGAALLPLSAKYRESERARVSQALNAIQRGR
jgi:hypothetical protein